MISALLKKRFFSIIMLDGQPNECIFFTVFSWTVLKQFLVTDFGKLDRLAQKLRRWDYIR